MWLLSGCCCCYSLPLSEMLLMLPTTFPATLIFFFFAISFLSCLPYLNVIYVCRYTLLFVMCDVEFSAGLLCIKFVTVCVCVCVKYNSACVCVCYLETLFVAPALGPYELCLMTTFCCLLLGMRRIINSCLCTSPHSKQLIVYVSTSAICITKSY